MLLAVWHTPPVCTAPQACRRPCALQSVHGALHSKHSQSCQQPACAENLGSPGPDNPDCKATHAGQASSAQGGDVQAAVHSKHAQSCQQPACAENLGSSGPHNPDCKATHDGQASSAHGGDACTWLLPLKRLPLALHTPAQALQGCCYTKGTVTRLIWGDLHPALAHVARRHVHCTPRDTAGCLAVTVSCYMHATCGLHATCPPLSFVCYIPHACCWPVHAIQWDMLATGYMLLFTCKIHVCQLRATSCSSAPALSESCLQRAPPPVCRHNPERYMQLVFAVSSVTMLVPVIFHLSQSKEKDSLDPNAPGGPMSQHDVMTEQLPGGQPYTLMHQRWHASLRLPMDRRV